MDGLVGMVLAAGGGSRFGGPKALATRPDGTPWLRLAVEVLRSAGCEDVVVVLGADADEARPLVPDGTRVVVAAGWRSGLGASLGAGLAGLPEADAVLVTLVDLPDLPVEVATRVLEGGTERDRLARAVFAERPGHPVLIGHDHWTALGDALHGDRGAAAYLEEHGVEHVECGDLFDGEDVDRRD